MGEGQREAEGERKPSAVCTSSAEPGANPDMGVDLTTLRSRPEPKSIIGCFTISDALRLGASDGQ